MFLLLILQALSGLEVAALATMLDPDTILNGLRELETHLRTLTIPDGAR